MFAYAFAQRQPLTGFAFGTWKINPQGAIPAGLLLGVAAHCWHSVRRTTVRSAAIRYAQASRSRSWDWRSIVCAWWLRDHHDHDHGQGHSHHSTDGHSAHHHDLNLRSAYVHVLADAATSSTDRRPELADFSGVRREMIGDGNRRRRPGVRFGRSALRDSSRARCWTRKWMLRWSRDSGEVVERGTVPARITDLRRNVGRGQYAMRCFRAWSRRPPSVPSLPAGFGRSREPST